MFRVASNNYRKLGLVIDSLARHRYNDRLTGCDDATRELRKDDRLVRNGEIAFGRMVPVVQADADDLPRPGNWGEPIGVSARNQPAFGARVAERSRVALESLDRIAGFFKPALARVEPRQWGRRPLCRLEQLLAVETIAAVFAIRAQDDAHARRFPL